MLSLARVHVGRASHVRRLPEVTYVTLVVTYVRARADRDRLALVLANIGVSMSVNCKSDIKANMERLCSLFCRSLER